MTTEYKRRTKGIFLRLLLFIPILSILGCSKINKKFIERAENQNFSQIKYYPKIKDSAKFISELKTLFKIEIQPEFSPKEYDKITLYKELKVFGSNENYYLIELDYADSFDAAYPWKFQFLIDSKGLPIKLFSSERIEIIKIFEKYNPFILSVESTFRGNGGHSLYKIQSDSLINCLNGSFKTYDANEDNFIFEPNELTLSFYDLNSDGYNDLIFSGKMIFLQAQNESGGWSDGKYLNGEFVNFSIENPYKIENIELGFIFNKMKNEFNEAENYKEKFKSYE